MGVVEAVAALSNGCGHKNMEMRLSVNKFIMICVILSHKIFNVLLVVDGFLMEKFCQLFVLLVR